MPHPDDFTIALVGCGKMGSAMVRSWLDIASITRIDILDPSPLPGDLAKHPAVQYNSSVQSMKTPDVLVLAVKPQIMDDVCSTVKPLLGENTLVLSIAAGQSIAVFEGHFGAQQPIIRAMPNTPAAIGKGMIVATANAAVSDEQKTRADLLLSANGLLEWIEDENLMNAVTALSGSGPAYVFLLIEMLTKAGIECGLDEEFSSRLARQTVIGAASLAEGEADTPAPVLRENVTSPGGTTEAALNVLMNSDMQEIFNQALRAAKDRGEALSS